MSRPADPTVKMLAPPKDAEKRMAQLRKRGLKPGNPGNRGGAKGRSGRTAYSVIAEATEQLRGKKLMQVLGHIAAGNIGELHELDDGTKVYTETKNSDRIKAIQLLVFCHLRGLGDGALGVDERGAPVQFPYAIEVPVKATDARTWAASVKRAG